MASDQRVHLFEEVEKHNKVKDCWVIVSGKVYDVSEFMEEHPGGEEVLLATTGKDATNDFEETGHSDSARNQMVGYCIGVIDMATVPGHRSYVPSKKLNYKPNQNNTMLQLLQLLLLIFGFTYALRHYNTTTTTTTTTAE